MFYLVASISLIGTASVFGIIEFQKSKKVESEKKALDKFYLEKLRTRHFTILNEDRREKGREWMINLAYEWLQETKEHMSKDGYNWQQILLANSVKIGFFSLLRLATFATEFKPNRCGIKMMRSAIICGITIQILTGV